MVAGGKTSQLFPMSDMVFQGTVLRPLLWNIFFKDAGEVIRACGFKDVVFADDINGMRFYPKCVCKHFIEIDMRSLQSKLHEWGRSNRVSFDASKEAHHILDKSSSSLPPFRLLGINFDTKFNNSATNFRVRFHLQLKIRSIVTCTKILYPWRRFDTI